MNGIRYFLTILLCCLSALVISEESEPLVVLVQQGKVGAGGSMQQYLINSGESFFVSVSGAQPPAGVQPPSPQDLRAAQLAKEINAKLVQLQNKTREYDTELYTVHRAPIELERQDLQRQLMALQNEQEKMDAQKTIREVEQKKIGAYQAKLAPTAVSGITVRATLMENDQVELQFNSHEAQSTSKTALDAWIQIPGVTPETWLKVKRK